MDFSSEENEEFFETLEDAVSSSDAESGGEGGHRMNASQSSIASASSAVNLSMSRYEVWKNSPGSIWERRKRLFMQMGLKLEAGESENSEVSVDAVRTEISLVPSSANPNEVEHTSKGCRNADCADREVSSRNGTYASSVSAGWTMVRSRSDGTVSSRLQNGENMGSSSSPRMVRSGTVSPVLHQRGHDRLNDTNGAVLRTASGPNHLSSKPPLGGKRVSGSSTPTAGEGLAARRQQFQWSKFGRFRVTDKNGNSLFHSTGAEGKSTDNTSAVELDLSGLPSGKIGDDTLKTANGEVLCRIKDLDSGKEFVVNEVGRDGMWNKLKELDTGREITLEEFESSLGLSPIVQEVMRRGKAAGDSYAADIQVDAGAGAHKRKKSWFNAIKGVVKGSRLKGSHSHHGSGSDDREGSTEKSGRKSGSVTDDSQDASPVSKPVKVRTHRKAVKEFADLRLRQEIHAHQGPIWTMKFSLDGAYLASAGQDKVVRVWEVLVHYSTSNESPQSSGELNLGTGKLIEGSPLHMHGDVNRSRKSMYGRKTLSSRLPMLFMLSENAKCVFKGHTEDVLDLCWSPSQSLLSSSMDKTVRLWNVFSKACLRIFTHNDYVTCIQFHPLDAGRFISGSLDGKVRIWNVQEPQVVDWVDLQEMVTAACYTPNGQGAVVGSYKGTCRSYKTSGNKLQLDTTFEVRSNKTKRTQGKQITGFQFVPGNQNKVLITSNDSCIRIYDGTEITCKFKGFRNSKSPISASFNTNGRFIICASEDSRVCIWNYNDHDYSGQPKNVSGSYEDFSAKHVLVAIPWPGMGRQPACLNPVDSEVLKFSVNLKKESSITRGSLGSGSYSPRSVSSNYVEAESVIGQDSDDTSSSTALENTGVCVADVSRVTSTLLDLQITAFSEDVSIFSSPRSDSNRGSSILSNCVSAQHVGNNGFFADSKGSATWPEEKLPFLQRSPRNVVNHNVNSWLNKDSRIGEHVHTTAVASAWGLVIVTAGLGGEIQIFQNYSLPVRL